MVTKHSYPELRGSVGAGFVTEELGRSITGCEVALSSASAGAWDGKIKNAQRAQDIALRFVRRFRLPDAEANRIQRRIVHLRSLLDELRQNPD